MITQTGYTGFYFFITRCTFFCALYSFNLSTHSIVFSWHKENIKSNECFDILSCKSTLIFLVMFSKKEQCKNFAYRSSEYQLLLPLSVTRGRRSCPYIDGCSFRSVWVYQLAMPCAFIYIMFVSHKVI